MRGDGLMKEVMKEKMKGKRELDRKRIGRPVASVGAAGAPARAPEVAAPAPNLSLSTTCSPSSFRFLHRARAKKLQPPH